MVTIAIKIGKIGIKKIFLASEITKYMLLVSDSKNP